MGDVGDDSAVTAAFGCKGYGCFDLWKHGTCSELIFCDIFVGIVHRNSIQQSLIVCIFVEADFFDAGEDQKCICIKLFCKKLTGKVFFDDGTCTVKMGKLTELEQALSGAVTTAELDAAYTEGVNEA